VAGLGDFGRAGVSDAWRRVAAGPASCHRRQLEEWAIRVAEAEQARHRRRLVEWWADRLVAAAEVLDLAAMLRDPRGARRLWIAECIGRIRMTDPVDTPATLLAARHGFDTAAAAGALLAQDKPDDAVLARKPGAALPTSRDRLRPGRPPTRRYRAYGAAA
jgi:hypothetical protein